MTDFKDKKKRPTVTVFPDYGKVPPQANDLEEAILGALMLESEAYTRVSYLLDSPDKMYREAHQKILGAIIALHERKFVIDLYTVTEELRVHNELDAVGGPFYLYTTRFNSRRRSLGIQINNQKRLLPL